MVSDSSSIAPAFVEVVDGRDSLPSSTDTVMTPASRGVVPLLDKVTTVNSDGYVDNDDVVLLSTAVAPVPRKRRYTPIAPARIYLACM